MTCESLCIMLMSCLHSSPSLSLCHTFSTEYSFKKPKSLPLFKAHHPRQPSENARLDKWTTQGKTEEADHSWPEKTHRVSQKFRLADIHYCLYGQRKPSLPLVRTISGRKCKQSEKLIWINLPLQNALFPPQEAGNCHDQGCNPKEQRTNIILENKQRYKGSLPSSHHIQNVTD